MSSATKMPCWNPRWASCRPGHDVADGVDVRQVGAQPLVGEDEPALHGHPGLLVAVPGRVRAAADRDEQQVGLDVLTGLERHRDRRPRSAWRR